MTFSNPAGANTFVALPGQGVYTFRVTVSDGDRQASDEVVVQARRTVGDVVLMPTGSVWKYLDNGSSPIPRGKPPPSMIRVGPPTGPPGLRRPRHGHDPQFRSRLQQQVHHHLSAHPFQGVRGRVRLRLRRKACPATTAW